MACFVRLRHSACFIAVITALIGRIKGDEQQALNDFASPTYFSGTVAPLLQKHCVACHGPEKQEGSLRLDTLEGMNAGGKSGIPLVPGSPDESLLITAVRRTDDSLQMPPDEELTESDVRALTHWIQSGAIHPDGRISGTAGNLPFDVEQARQFWAFQPLQISEVPRSSSGDSKESPVDFFLAAKLREKHLTRNPVADKTTLIRRATFTLTGLPPSPEQINEFLGDSSPDAFSRLIDRLLATPHYGERWGRHWLDVVRYADSNGLDENIAHGNAWRYRNYVIDSFNADKPYDQFVREQIAGDLLVNDTTDEATRIAFLTATGFLSLGPKVLAEGDETKMHMDIVDEQIDTIGRALLGLTVGCARCHDHKFDPIAHSDYYALAGIFQSTKTMESLKRIARWNENSIATLAERVSLETHMAKIEAKKAEINALIADATTSIGSSLTAPPEESLPEEIRERLQTARDDLKQLEQSIPELPTAMGVTDGDITNARVLLRGSHLSPGRTVHRGVPVVLAKDGFAVSPKQSGRLELANWLTDKKNPLTARVIANRVWRWHFGRGLVVTADNFGRLGEVPSNPALLDWLANELIRNEWSLKSLHRTIMLTETWQQSSEVNLAAEEVDPENRLLWRWTVQRLEAESVRDAVLATTGLLDRSSGTSMLHVKNREFLFDHTSKDGTSYKSLRRSVYLPVIRNNLYDAMSLFDCTDGTVPNGDRASSTVASQALFLMNSDFMMEAAEHLASRIIEERLTSTESRIEAIAMRALGRSATESDIRQWAAATHVIERQLASDGVSAPDLEKAVWTTLCHAALMSNEFLYVR